MTKFIQIHTLTSFPASNLNRDQFGAPKSLMFGGRQRTRISSQAIKRAMRTGNEFDQFERGVRTRLLPKFVMNELVADGTPEKEAKAIADAISVIARGEEKAKPKPGGKKGAKNADAQAEVSAVVEGEAAPGADAEDKKDGKDTITFYSRREFDALLALAHEAAAKNTVPAKAAVLNVLRDNRNSMTLDIAMSGRMLAKHKDYNVDAAVAVAHAFTVHGTKVETDYFTAVDDISDQVGVAASAHLDEASFNSGLFYGYASVNLDLLRSNLGDDADSASAAMRALTRSLATVFPSGKRNSFASWARASYILVEVGENTPRQLATAFLEAIEGPDMLPKAIAALRSERDKFARAYDEVLTSAEMSVPDGVGSLREVADFAANA